MPEEAALPGLAALLSLTFIVSTIRIAIPYLFASLGAAFSERGGTINIGLEGMMLGGAFGYVVGAHYAGGASGPLPELAGVAAGVALALLLAAIHALVCVWLRADQIVSGLAVNILMIGASRLFLKIIFHSSSNSDAVASIGSYELFAPDSTLRPINSLLHPLIVAALILVPLLTWTLYRTRFGLRLRSVGEHPLAAETLGIRVLAYRTGGVLISGVLAGLAGVWLAADQGLFVHEMTGGRGYIALAVMILGKWHPLGVAGASLLFGGAETLAVQLQTWGGISLPLLGVVSPPNELIQMVPYLLTLAVLAGFIGGCRPPAAVGQPYIKEMAR